jgi:hypothetical protein
VAEPVSEQVAAKIKTTLAAIVGDSGSTYWYTPSAVYRAPALVEGLLDRSLASTPTIYVLIPDEKEPQYSAFGRLWTTASYDLVCLQSWELPTSDAAEYQSSTLRETVQNRMEADVRKALFTDPTLGGLAITVDIPFVDQSAENTWFEGWAMTMLRVVVQFEHAATTL